MRKTAPAHLRRTATAEMVAKARHSSNLRQSSTGTTDKKRGGKQFTWVDIVNDAKSTEESGKEPPKFSNFQSLLLQVDAAHCSEVAQLYSEIARLRGDVELNQQGVPPVLPVNELSRGTVGKTSTGCKSLESYFAAAESDKHYVPTGASDRRSRNSCGSQNSQISRDYKNPEKLEVGEPESSCELCSSPTMLLPDSAEVDGSVATPSALPGVVAADVSRDASPSRVEPDAPMSQKKSSSRRPDAMLKVRVISARGLRRSDWLPGQSSDPYCVVSFDRPGSADLKTKFIERNQDPIWNHDFVIADYMLGDSLVFKVYDKDWGPMSDDLLGEFVLPGTQIEPDGFEGEVKLLETGGAESYLRISVQIEPDAELDESLFNRLPHWDIEPKELGSTFGSTFYSAMIPHKKRVASESIPEKDEANQDQSLCLKKIFEPIQPTSQGRLTWDVIGMIVLVAELLWIPMQVFQPPEGSDLVQAFGWVTLIYWTLDIFASFNTAYYTGEGALVHRRYSIARRYCRGWLFFDVLLISIDWFQIIMSGVRTEGEEGTVGAARVVKVVRLMRLLRLLRLMRLAKIRELLFKLQDLIHSEAVMVFFAVGKNICMIFTMNHYLACLWFAVGEACGDQGWVVVNDFANADFADKYIVSIQWTIAQFTPGAPPLHPKALTERMFHVAILALGLIVATVFVSSITSAMGVTWNAKRYNAAQAFLLKKYLSQNKVSPTLATRVTRYVECILMFRQRKIQPSKVHYLELLSTPLTQLVHTEINLPFLSTCSFFKACTSINVESVEQLCTSALGSSCFAAHDYLFTAGTVSTHMSFVTHGSTVYRCVLAGDLYKQMAKVSKQQWFCEGSLWVEWIHPGDMKALMEISTITLPATRFFEVLRAHEDAFQLARTRAKEFQREARALSLFDLGPTDVVLDFFTGKGHREGGIENMSIDAAFAKKALNKEDETLAIFSDSDIE